ncbi:hypothetical protein [Isoptericola variabilis]|uniref:Uncharacterized protein n=1 Tax=Isoptericola variabilis (strain 225) TaxID=743718 RepID=F6FU73_ISOV2|nr:hypothetical protein [Isoptericola variabilis]AEG43269.1 hypothetical protein Isova_0472 [Isoptericola variabilis 225]TWH35204.1 hypothetical protein L600_000100002080 [Isoptericola variabilis J7]
MTRRTRQGGRGTGGETRTGAALGLLGEVLLAGILAAVGSLLVVTAVPSLAAAVAHVRRQVAGLDVGVGRFAREWWAAVRTLWTLGLAAVGIAVLLAFDMRLAGSGVLPGGQVVAAVVALAAAVAVVVLLRAAGTWSDDEGTPAGTGAREALVVGAERARDDLVGSVLLLVGVGLCLTFVWMLPPLALLVGGLLALAVVGVEVRRRGLDAERAGGTDI